MLYFANRNIQHYKRGTGILYIHQYIQWQDGIVSRNGRELYYSAGQDAHSIALDIYQQSGITYPKFFKMDILSRVAFLASEMIIPQPVNEDKDHVAVVFSTTSGCLDVDHKFEESRQTLASPALFVYTLPNIMLGEVCIRNGFKGEQMCTIAEGPDANWFGFYVGDLLHKRGTEACLCGYVDATATHIRAVMLWVSKAPSSLPFTPAHLTTILNSSL